MDSCQAPSGHWRIDDAQDDGPPHWLTARAIGAMPLPMMRRLPVVWAKRAARIGHGPRSAAVSTRGDTADKKRNQVQPAPVSLPAQRIIFIIIVINSAQLFVYG